MPPLFLISLIRPLIIAVGTGSAITVVQNTLDGSFKKLIEEIRDDQNLTQGDATDVVADIVWDLVVNSATVALVVRSRAFVKIAERLGFTSKGFASRKLTPKAAVAKKVVMGPWEKFKAFSLASKLIISILGVQSLVWIGNIFIQAIEPGIYKARETNDIWEKFIGIRPFPEKGFSLAPANFKADTFAQYANSLEAAGIKGFNDPVNKQSRLYSREDLAGIVDWVYGRAILAGKTFSDWRGVVPLVTPYLIGANGAVSVVGTAQVAATAGRTTGVKTFIGTVSSGVLGKGLSFTPRPDDLIESMGELQAAINDNLSPWLVALPSRLVYEIKVVSSIIGSDGVKKVGEARTIITGQDKDGRDKTKNVINKWAVMDIYAFTDKKTRTKITSIVLGPTDAVKFHPGAQELVPLSQAVASSAVTVDTDDIDVVVSATPTAEEVRPTEAAPKATTLFEYYQAKGQPLPSLSDRAELYQSLGLGQASLYVGTAEQNTRLLNKLQEQTPLAEVLTTSTRASEPEKVGPTTPEVIRRIPPPPLIKEFFTRRGPEGRNVTQEKIAVQTYLALGMDLNDVPNLIQNEIQAGRESQFYPVTLEWFRNLA